MCLLALGALGLAAGSGASVRVGEAELYVSYTGANIVQVMLAGQVIRSGGSIPAGTYVVLVYDDGYNATPRFLMSGPGVNISSDLNSSGMGIDGVSTFGPYTFPTGASYTVQQQGGPSVTFGTTASSGGSAAVEPAVRAAAPRADRAAGRAAAPSRRPRRARAAPR